jgi:hypothetical protein
VTDALPMNPQSVVWPTAEAMRLRVKYRVPPDGPPLPLRDPARALMGRDQSNKEANE